jgi:uncharacterized protein YkwD
MVCRFRSFGSVLFAWGVLTNLGACASERPSHFGTGLPVVAASSEIRALERQMFQRLNRDRAREGKQALAYDDRLADVARSHSEDMRAHSFFDHVSKSTGTPQNRLDSAGYLFLTARENLAQAGSVDQAEDDLLKSPHHHENMMATDITLVGIGIVRVTETPPTLLVTQVFARPGKSETVSAARQSVAGMIQNARKSHKLPALVEISRLQKLAEQELASMPNDPTESDLRKIRDRISAKLGHDAEIHGVAVGGQVLPDTTEFQVSQALLRPTARGFGLAVEKSGKHGERPMVRVLVLVGL